MLIAIATLFLSMPTTNAADGDWAAVRRNSWDSFKPSVGSRDLRGTSPQLRWNSLHNVHGVDARIPTTAGPHDDPLANPFGDRTEAFETETEVGTDNSLGLNAPGAVLRLDQQLISSARPMPVTAVRALSVNRASHEVSQPLSLSAASGASVTESNQQSVHVQRGYFDTSRPREPRFAQHDYLPPPATQEDKERLRDDFESLNEPKKSRPDVEPDYRLPEQDDGELFDPFKWFESEKSGASKKPSRSRQTPPSSSPTDGTSTGTLDDGGRPKANEYRDPLLEDLLPDTENDDQLTPKQPNAFREREAASEGDLAQLAYAAPFDRDQISYDPDERRDLDDLFIDEDDSTAQDQPTVRPELHDDQRPMEEDADVDLDDNHDFGDDNILKDLEAEMIDEDASDSDLQDGLDDSLLDDLDDMDLPEDFDSDEDDLLRGLDEFERDQEEEQDEEKDADAQKCDRVYNDRNCCEHDQDCSEVLEDLRGSRVSAISLNISPSFDPTETDDAEVDNLRKKKLAQSPFRSWCRASGTVVAEGYLEDFRFGTVHVRTQEGKVTKIRYQDLDRDDLCFVNAWWGLPSECTLADATPTIRDWTMMTFTWRASELCHKPLYFEDKNLERYGHSHGPFIQPLMSAAHFVVNAALLPYNSGVHPPNDCIYALGDYRVGSCAPWLVPAFPLSRDGAVRQTVAILGLWGFLH